MDVTGFNRPADAYNPLRTGSTDAPPPVVQAVAVVPAQLEVPVEGTVVGILLEMRQSMRTVSTNVQESAAVCAARCCGRVGLFVLLYVVLVGALAIGAAASGSMFVYTLLLFAPVVIFLVFLSRTFGRAIDRCQVCLSFFTAACWMIPLMLLVSLLPYTGLYRVIYELDQTCGACLDRGLCTDTCRGNFPPETTVCNVTTESHGNCTAAACPARNVPTSCDDHGSGGLFDGVTDPPGCCSWGTDCRDCGRRSYPLATDDMAGGVYGNETVAGCACVLRTAFVSFGRAALLEESLKFLAVIGIYTKDWVADPRALVLYAAASAGGFAGFENAVNLGAGAYTGALFRAATAIPMHVSTGLIIGARLGHVRFLGKSSSCWLVVLGWPIFFHGFYDFCIFGGVSQMLGLDSPELQVFGQVLGFVLAIGTMAASFVFARYEFIKLAAVPRVDVRTLQRSGVLPRATFGDWLFHSFFCCNWPYEWCCDSCFDRRDRGMRLSFIQRAASPPANTSAALESRQLIATATAVV
jgi:hypothetical protein